MVHSTAGRHTQGHRWGALPDVHIPLSQRSMIDGLLEEGQWWRHTSGGHVAGSWTPVDLDVNGRRVLVQAEIVGRSGTHVDVSVDDPTGTDETEPLTLGFDYVSNVTVVSQFAAGWAEANVAAPVAEDGERRQIVFKWTAEAGLEVPLEAWLSVGSILSVLQRGVIGTNVGWCPAEAWFDGERRRIKFEIVSRRAADVVGEDPTGSEARHEELLLRRSTIVATPVDPGLDAIRLDVVDGRDTTSHLLGFEYVKRTASSEAGIVYEAMAPMEAGGFFAPRELTLTAGGRWLLDELMKACRECGNSADETMTGWLPATLDRGGEPLDVIVELLGRKAVPGTTNTADWEESMKRWMTIGVRHPDAPDGGAVELELCFVSGGFRIGRFDVDWPPAVWDAAAEVPDGASSPLSEHNWTAPHDVTVPPAAWPVVDQVLSTCRTWADRDNIQEHWFDDDITIGEQVFAVNVSIRRPVAVAADVAGGPVRKAAAYRLAVTVTRSDDGARVLGLDVIMRAHHLSRVLGFEPGEVLQLTK